MAALPVDLIARPAVEGARLVALAYLEQSRSALARLDDPEDTDALHDFRVALRRLRSTLRAYRAQLRGSVTGKLCDRVRDLTRSTNRGRDAEVQLAWLRPLADELGPAERVGLRWLVEWIEHAREQTLEETREQVRRCFDKLDRQVRKKLGVCRRPLAPNRAAPEPVFGLVAREALLTQVKRLDDLLGAIPAADDHATMHRARIAAKRLRYLLEPFREALPAGPDLLSSLKSLQDVLGELCDTQVLEVTLLQAVEAAGAQRARRRFETALADGAGAGLRGTRRRETRGLLAVAVRLRRRRRTAYARLETTWLGGGDVFVDRVRAATQRLVFQTRGAPVPPPPSVLRRPSTRRPRVKRPR
jgi:CHAD domain-containing protein